MDNLESKIPIFDPKYLEIEWFHQAYVFHPLAVTPEQVWNELSVEEKQKLKEDAKVGEDYDYMDGINR